MDTKRKTKIIMEAVKDYYYRQLERRQAIKNAFAPSEVFIIPSGIQINEEMKKFIGGGKE